jgi:predicted metal-dependent HD superfamily phosphohydrolase
MPSPAPEPELSEADALELAWTRHIADDRRLLDGLLARHREKQRRYHRAAHVASVIRHIDELAATEPVDHLDEVVAAAFFHDAVYEPTHPANERASARLARRDLAALGWSAERTERVGAMIEATAHAGTDNPLGDTAILLDADLAILGAEPDAYSAYAASIRAEYRHLDDGEWRAGRAAVLRGFLDRPTIYATATARSTWEQPARTNIAAELATLTA